MFCHYDGVKRLKQSYINIPESCSLLITYHLLLYLEKGRREENGFTKINTGTN